MEWLEHGAFEWHAKVRQDVSKGGVVCSMILPGLSDLHNEPECRAVVCRGTVGAQIQLVVAGELQGQQRSVPSSTVVGW